MEWLWGDNVMLFGSARKFMKGGLSPAHVWSSVVLGFLLGMIPDYGASAGLLAIPVTFPKTSI